MGWDAGFSGGFTLDVSSPALASAGSSIEGDAGALASVATGLGAVGGVDGPRLTARALEELSSQWVAGVGSLQGDLESLGRGLQGAATLYTQTDETAMRPG